MHSIIHVISSPRNISTALMYSFANRGDLKVVDEPFYAYYLNRSTVYHPGKKEIIASQPTKFEAVIAQIENLQLKSPVFLKDMAQHLHDVDLQFLKHHKNVLLIRNPKQQIFSFSKVIEQPTARDIGLSDQYIIFKYLKQHSIPFTVVDSNQLLQNPKKVLSELCEQLNLPFTDKMLHWQAGAIPEDGIWAKYWYESVHQSTGWKYSAPKDFKLPLNLEPLYKSVLPYYEELFSYAIKA